MRRSARWILKLAVLLPLFAGLAEAAGDGARFQGFDVIGLPGEAVPLEAKVEGGGLLHPNLHGVPVILRLAATGEEIGRATSGDEGIARVDWTPPADAGGEIDVEAVLAGGAPVSAAPAPLRVFVWRADRPVLVVDVDGTISLGSALQVLTGDVASIPAREGAADALTRLAKRYAVCYLTARDESQIARTRRWLDEKGFPHGPVLVRDLGLFTLSAQHYKTERLKRLEKRFHLVAGVGDREDDADAYLAAGLRAFLIGSTRRVPPGAEKVETWAQIEERLLP